uniref:Uncharacterized protein n=1 Tax=Micrurus spixii TaxID=129469 RepID=A0A2D4MZT7_9SAUR
MEILGRPGDGSPKGAFSREASWMRSEKSSKKKQKDQLPLEKAALEERSGFFSSWWASQELLTLEESGWLEALLGPFGPLKSPQWCIEPQGPHQSRDSSLRWIWQISPGCLEACPADG